MSWWLAPLWGLVAMSRTAWDGSHNAHDANHLTFHRIPGSRERTLEGPPLNEPTEDAHE